MQGIIFLGEDHRSSPSDIFLTPENKIGLKSNEIITKGQVIRDLKNLGLKKGDFLLINCSLGEIGWVEGGVEALLDAILESVGPDGSILVYSFTPLYRLPLKQSKKPKMFDPGVSPRAGKFVDIMMQHPGAIRSTHPSCSYVGIGNGAEKILEHHNPSSFAYQPSHELAKLSNGKQLKIGTLQKLPGMATIHLSQNLLNFNNRALGRYGVRYRDENGEMKLYKRNYVGGCSAGFGKFYELYRNDGVASEGKVGNADTMLVNLKQSLEIDMEQLTHDPKFFFCDDPLCYSCRVTWDFSPESPLYFKLKLNATKLFPRLKRFLR